VLQRLPASSHVAAQEAAGAQTVTSPPSASTLLLPTIPARAVEQQSVPRSLLVSQIKSAEAALACLPIDAHFTEQRSALETKVSELKQSITHSKPVGARIDGARAMLCRARKRKEAAVEECTVALAAQEPADREIMQVQLELAELEAQSAAAPPPIAGNSHFENVTEKLTLLFAQMSQDAFMAPEHLQVARDFSHQFLGGMKKTLLCAAAAKESDASSLKFLFVVVFVFVF
jgi:hypothetical protein